MNPTLVLRPGTTAAFKKAVLPRPGNTVFIDTCLSRVRHLARTGEAGLSPGPAWPDTPAIRSSNEGGPID
jgi:hypothetical protein